MATEISKTINSTKVIDIFLSADATKLPEQRLPDRFYAATLEKEREWVIASGTKL